MIQFLDALRNSTAFNLIKHDIETGNLSHAYMIVSPDAYAVKQLFALIACTVYCPNDACLDCNICNRVLHNNHSDVKYVNELDKTIKVEEITNLINDATTRPFESENKLYFVYSADKMNAAAQNKLLKTLEEPQPSVSIFLGVGRESAMLDTIKSRSKKIYLDRFSTGIVQEEIFKLCNKNDTALIAATCCDGLLGRAKEIMENGAYIELYDRALDILSNLKKSGDIASYINDVALNKENMPAFLDILSVIIRDMISAKSNPDLIQNKHKRKEIEDIGKDYSVRALANILYLINNERKKINFYVSNIGIAENLLFGILEVKYKCQ